MTADARPEDVIREALHALADERVNRGANYGDVTAAERALGSLVARQQELQSLDAQMRKPTCQYCLADTRYTPLRIWRIKSRIWVTTGGKDHYVLVPRWRLVLAAFSRKDVRW